MDALVPSAGADDEAVVPKPGAQPLRPRSSLGAQLLVGVVLGLGAFGGAVAVWMSTPEPAAIPTPRVASSPAVGAEELTALFRPTETAVAPTYPATTPVRPTSSPTSPPPKPTARPPGPAGVPEVIGKSEANANKLIRDAGLTIKVVEQRAAGLRDGIVVDQTPSAGGQVLAGSTVTIVVGRGLGPATPKVGSILMPNVEGMDERGARTTLEDAGFKVTIVRGEAPDRKGQVIDQYPGSGDTVAPGTTVRITIGT
jgi:beta-lactam-binding protein with PASTA domain